MYLLKTIMCTFYSRPQLYAVEGAFYYNHTQCQLCVIKRTNKQNKHISCPKGLLLCFARGKDNQSFIKALPK